MPLVINELPFNTKRGMDHSRTCGKYSLIKQASSTTITGEIHKLADSLASCPPNDIYIVVLKGGFYLASRLMEIGFLEGINRKIGFVKVESYKGMSPIEPKLLYGPDLPDSYLDEKVVWLVDDIYDSGATLSLLKEVVLSAGAKEVKTVVLVERITSKKPQQHSTMAALLYHGDGWLVGCGMGMEEQFRLLPELCSLAIREDKEIDNVSD